MKGIVWVIFSLLLVAGMPLVGMSADVNVNINVPPPPPPPAPPEAPPPLEFAAPPDVVVVPSGTASVYLVPNTVGLYFYGGYWYRSYRGSWFRASVYNGPWGSVAATLVPRPVFVIPPDYVLGMPPGYHHIHYHEFHSHWRAWDRQHYWHNQPWYRDHSQHHWGDREFVRPVRHDEIRRADRGPHDKGGKVVSDRKTIGGPHDKNSKVNADRKAVGADRGHVAGSPGGAGPAGGSPKAGTGGHGPGSGGGSKVGTGGPGNGGHGGGGPAGAGAKPGHAGKPE